MSNNQYITAVFEWASTRVKGVLVGYDSQGHRVLFGHFVEAHDGCVDGRSDSSTINRAMNCLKELERKHSVQAAHLLISPGQDGLDVRSQTLTVSIDEDRLITLTYLRDKMAEHMGGLLDASMASFSQHPLTIHLDDQSIEIGTQAIKGQQLQVDYLTFLQDQSVFSYSQLLGECREWASVNVDYGGRFYDLILDPECVSSDYYVIVDVGAKWTTGLLFFNGHLQKLCCFKVGGSTLTSDISICLKQNLTTAERLKRHGVNLDQPDYARLSQKVSMLVGDDCDIDVEMLQDVVKARIDEWGGMLKDQLAQWPEYQADTNLVMAGNGFNVKGITPYLQKLEFNILPGKWCLDRQFVEKTNLCSLFALLESHHDVFQSDGHKMIEFSDSDSGFLNKLKSVFSFS